ncbi:transcriptional regulator, XRE family [Kribbella flavida DSM 17836]|uniref:Transcriptional regulator, XRE family n=1 Tax=Kribbella flavida (strain DSM 17836 / JCM 10339 / NBRC 14399) TaxID=479435 RepID=D2PYA8_KRIFD|nr:helix-turn-helix transcriptional regulator [Kribbella flavida]ADB35476.1 transcriptional regulator, XRE family [Kribbella flavida DSM 17836]
MEYGELSDFLRKRREALQPEDVGMPRGRRRRTPGLRREEVASLASMSADYYSRLEGGRGPQPSPEMLAAIARALRLTADERDYLFVLAQHGTPPRVTRLDHVNPGLLRILDRLDDTPAVVLNRLHETLAQTSAHVAFDGEQTNYEGLERSAVYRWFTGNRGIYFEQEWDHHSRVLVSGLRAVVAADGPKSQAGTMARILRETSAEFAELWEAHEVGHAHSRTKWFRHPVVGDLELHCQVMEDRDQQQTLLVFTATPGSESAHRLELLSVVGSQQLAEQ